MATANSREAAIEQLGKLIKGIRTTMMVTMGNGATPHGRPMYTQDVPFNGVLWFMTSVDSRKVRELRRNARVQLSYISTSYENYVTVDGTAQVLNDRARIAEFWNPMLKAWYEGPDDPTLRVIRVEVDRAEFWDSPGGKIGSLLSIAKAIVTGKEDDGGYGEVTLNASRKASKRTGKGSKTSRTASSKKAGKRATSSKGSKKTSGKAPASKTTRQKSARAARSRRTA